MCHCLSSHSSSSSHSHSVILCHHTVLHLPIHKVSLSGITHSFTFPVSLLSRPSFGYYEMLLLHTAAVCIILFALACLDVCPHEKYSRDSHIKYKNGHHPQHRNDQTLPVIITLGLEKNVLRNILLFLRRILIIIRTVVIRVRFVFRNFMLAIIWVTEVREHHIVRHRLRQQELCIRGVSVTLTADTDAA